VSSVGKGGWRTGAEGAPAVTVRGGGGGGRAPGAEGAPVIPGGGCFQR